jgi:hypothetical protein
MSGDVSRSFHNVEDGCRKCLIGAVKGFITLFV